MKHTLIAAVILCLAAPAFAENVTVTGSNGGSLVSTGSCQKASGQATCASTTTLTGPNGKVSTRARSTTAGGGQLTSTLSGTRANGKTFGRTVKASR